MGEPDHIVSGNKLDIASYTHQSIFDVVQPDKHLVVKLRSFKDLSTIENDITQKMLSNHPQSQTAFPMFPRQMTDFQYGSLPGSRTTSGHHTRQSTYTALSSQTSLTQLPDATRRKAVSRGTSPVKRTSMTRIEETSGAKNESIIGENIRRSSIDKSIDENQPKSTHKSDEVFVQLSHFTKKPTERNIDFIQINKNQLENALGYLEEVQSKVKFASNVRREFQQIYSSRPAQKNQSAHLQQTTQPSSQAAAATAASSMKTQQKQQPPLTLQSLSARESPIKLKSQQKHDDPIASNKNPITSERRTSAQKPTLATIESINNSSIISAQKQQIFQWQPPQQLNSVTNSNSVASSFSQKQFLSPETILTIPSSHSKKKHKQHFFEEEILATPAKKVTQFSTGTQYASQLAPVQSPKPLILIDDASLIYGRLNRNSKQRNSSTKTFVDTGSFVKTPVKVPPTDERFSSPVAQKLSSISSTNNHHVMKSSLASSRQMFFNSPASTNAESNVKGSAGTSQLSDSIMQKRTMLESTMSELNFKGHNSSSIMMMAMNQSRSILSPKKARFEETLKPAIFDAQAKYKQIVSKDKQNNPALGATSRNEQGIKVDFKSERVQQSNNDPNSNIMQLSSSQPFNEILSPIFTDQNRHHLFASKDKEILNPSVVAADAENEDYSETITPSMRLVAEKEKYEKIFKDPGSVLEFPESIQKVIHLEEGVESMHGEGVDAAEGKAGRISRYDVLFQNRKDFDRFKELPAVSMSVTKSGISDFIRKKKVEDMDRMKTFYRFAFNPATCDQNSEKLHSVMKEIIPENEKGSLLCNELWSDRHVKTICERTNFAKEKDLVHMYISYKTRNPAKGIVIQTVKKGNYTSIGSRAASSSSSSSTTQKQQKQQRKSFISRSTPPPVLKMRSEEKSIIINEGGEGNESAHQRKKENNKQEVGFKREQNLFQDFLSYTTRVLKNNQDDLKSIKSKIKEEEEAQAEEEAKAQKRPQKPKE